MAHNNPTITAIHDLILSYFPENILNIDSPLYPIVSQNVDSFLRKQISYRQLYDSINSLVKFTQPIEKLELILETSSEPISAPSDEDLERSNVRRKSRQWTNYEDQRLLCAIYKYGIENWTQISKFVGNGRTRSQCSQRWYRGLNPNICKDQWSKEEERKLVELVKVHGDKSWTNISAKMGNRSDVQCRYRYRQLMREPGSNETFPENNIKSESPESNPLTHKGRKPQNAKVGQNQINTPYMPTTEQPPTFSFQPPTLTPINSIPPPAFTSMYYMQPNNFIQNTQLIQIPNNPQQFTAPMGPIVMVPNQQIIPVQPMMISPLPSETIIQRAPTVIETQPISIANEIPNVKPQSHSIAHVKISTPPLIQKPLHQAESSKTFICSPEDVKNDHAIVNSPSIHLQMASVVKSPTCFLGIPSPNPFINPVQSPRYFSSTANPEGGTIEPQEQPKIVTFKAPTFDGKMYSVY